MGDSQQSPHKSGYRHMWVVTDHPTDMPDYYVARLWLVDVDADGVIVARHVTDRAMVSKDLSALRRLLASMGHIPLDRSPDDDPVIIETWI